MSHIPSPQKTPLKVPKMNVALDLTLSLLPIIFLLTVTLKPNGMKSQISLPIASFILYILRLTYFQSAPNVVHAAVLVGILGAFTPISIVFGAIFLFETMEKTKCMEWMLRQLKVISKGNEIAEIMLIGWAFTYLLEGASGFGTPTALAAPILANSGLDPMKAVDIQYTSDSFWCRWYSNLVWSRVRSSI
jgi:lactate permease